MPEDPGITSPPVPETAQPDLQPPPNSSSLNPPQLITLAPLVEDLGKAVTCPICLDYMEDAKQLQCSHLFCATCVVGMLGMENVRCAVCKEKTGKRMVRDAPIRYEQIVKYLRMLEGILVECNIRPKENDAINDGYGSLQNRSTSFQRQNTSAMATLSLKRNFHSVTPTHKRCYLCPKGVDSISFGDKVSFGAIFPASSEKKRILFVHERCALFTDDVYEGDGKFHNVQKLVARNEKFVCARDACGRTRANINCEAQGCDARYHFPCAVVDGCVLVEDGLKMFCPLHKGKAPNIEDGEFKKTLSDPNESVAKEHDDCCFVCKSGGRLLMCDTCTRVSHPVCSGLTAIPTGDWSCGVCQPAAEFASGYRKRSASKQATPKRRKRSIASLAGPDDDNDQSASKSRKVCTARKGKRPRASLEAPKRHALAHTGLQDSEREYLRDVAKTKKATIRSDVDRRVTHLVIRPLSAEETPMRTMKLCKAVAAQVPIVCWKWVEDSAKSEMWLPVEAYLHPLTWPKDVPAVFEGKRFYFGGYDGSKEKKDDLISLIGLGGGVIVSREPSADPLFEEETMCVKERDSQEYCRRGSSRHELPTGVQTVSATWILDCCTKNRS